MIVHGGCESLDHHAANCRAARLLRRDWCARCEASVEALELRGTRFCARCGCTDLDACDGGCYWATNTLCSACVLASLAGV